MLYDVRIPMYERSQLLTGKLIAYTTKLYIMLSCTLMYLTSAGFCPFRNIAVCVNAALTYAVYSFGAARAALSTSSYRSEIYRLFLAHYLLLISFLIRFSISYQPLLLQLKL